MSNKNDKSVAAIVVTYNRRELLIKCIESILNQKNAECDILIIDNASTDGTKEYITSLKIDQLFYFNTKRNLGGAGGFYYGIKKAAQLGYKYMWLMDDDTFPKDDALEELLKADSILNGDYGFLSSAVLWKDGQYCKMNCQKITKTAYKKVHLLKESLLPVYQATFVSLWVKRDVVIQQGLPIKEFFIWADDVEYTHRLYKKADGYLVGKSQVVHYTSNNVGSSISEDDRNRIERYRYAYRNENYIARKEGIKGVVYYLAKCCLNIGRVLLKAKDHRMKRCWVIMSQMVLGVFFNPKIEYIENK